LKFLIFWRQAVQKGPNQNWFRKVATANFRLTTRHDVLQEHLHRFNIVKEPVALCKLEDQDGEHLFRCPDLKSEIDSLPTLMDRTEIAAHLYWTARKRNSQIS